MQQRRLRTTRNFKKVNKYIFKRERERRSKEFRRKKRKRIKGEAIFKDRIYMNFPELNISTSVLILKAQLS